MTCNVTNLSLISTPKDLIYARVRDISDELYVKEVIFSCYDCIFSPWLPHNRSMLRLQVLSVKRILFKNPVAPRNEVSERSF